MIEADVIIGNHHKFSTKTEIVAPANATADELAAIKAQSIPIMGHPPYLSSDLSLDQFLTRVIEFNKKNATKPKGIKLDFKTIEAVNQSIPMLKTHWENVRIKHIKLHRFFYLAFQKLLKIIGIAEIDSCVDKC